MSWSCKTRAKRDDARRAFIALLRQQGAYSAGNKDHRDTLDQIAQFGADVAECQAPEAEVVLSTYGHLNDNGTGEFTVVVSLGKPVEKPEAPAEPRKTRGKTKDSEEQA